MTNQNTLSLARGPIVYCVEDYDNPWVDDHFKVRSVSFGLDPRLIVKTVHLDSNCKIDERSVWDSDTGDKVIGLTVSEGAWLMEIEPVAGMPWVDARRPPKLKPIKELNFVPYYFRADRGGRGHMRVGLKKLAEHPTGGAGGRAFTAERSSGKL